MNTTLAPSKTPIVAVSVRGGVVGDVRSNIPVNLVVEDFDGQDEVTPKRFALAAGVLDANDEAELIRQLDLAPHGNADLSELEIDNLIQELLRRQRQVAVIWCCDDVKHVRPDLTDAQAWEALQQCREQHDCEYGFTWTLIEDVAEDLFGDAPDTGEADEEPPRPLNP
jgi:hypothetical protein